MIIGNGFKLHFYGKDLLRHEITAVNLECSDLESAIAHFKSRQKNATNAEKLTISKMIVNGGIYCCEQGAYHNAVTLEDDQRKVLYIIDPTWI